ncbi:MAG: flagellar export chaperone FlgN [Candidatus Latescibacterota bacterium]|jgi:flagellar biosynthesis/type III secretory pathway chaperone
MIDAGQKIEALLEAQLKYYRAMKLAVEKQTAYIEAMDIGGLTTGTSETRALMRKVRDLEAELRPLRQSWNNLGLDRPVIEKRRIDGLIDEMRSLLESIQVLKDHNQSLLERSMEDVRQQLSGLKKRKQMSNAYQPKPRMATAARFIDRSK